MFTIPAVNVIQSDSGFSIKVLGRTGLEYREGEKVLTIDSELLHKTGIAVYTDSIRAWNPPFQANVITPEEQKRIIENIVAAFAFRNEPIEVH